MQDLPLKAQKQQVLARLEIDRAKMVEAVNELRRPLHSVQRFQQKAQRFQHQAVKVLPIVLVALVVGGVAFLLLRLLRGKSKTAASHAVSAKPKVGILGTILELISIYKLATQIGAALPLGGLKPKARPSIPPAPHTPVGRPDLVPPPPPMDKL